MDNISHGMGASNGTLELRRKRIDAETEVVLAVWNGNGRPELVTWVAGSGQKNPTERRRHFSTLTEAINDFQHRQRK